MDTKSLELMQGYNYLGVRALQDDEDYKVGEITRNSLDWDAENDCSSDQELSGICAVEVDMDDDNRERAIEETLAFVRANYWGGTAVLLGAHGTEHGNDPSEIIMRNAQVIAIYK